MFEFPFGLSTAHYVFTKLLKPVVKYLTEQALTSVFYLDDALLIGNSKEDCNKNIEITRNLLQSLGFLINYKKSSLKPSKEIKFLGFVFKTKKPKLKQN